MLGRLGVGLAIGALTAKALDLMVDGALTLDTGVGRRVQSLGPRTWRIDASRGTVFEIIEGPYRRTPRAMRDKLHVWERSDDMVLAAHMTHVGRRRITTVETVRFERPERIHFRLVRGPVPHVSEVFELADVDGATELTWRGELATDFGAAGAAWGRRVARAWEHAVERSIASVTAEAERRSRHRA